MNAPATQESVAARQAQNPHCAQLTHFLFVEHETFELLPEVLPYLEYYFKTPNLGPVEFLPFELTDVSPRGLVLKQANDVRRYWQQHALRSRFLYAFTNDPNASPPAPEFLAELWIDAKGLIHVLPKAAF